jgi:hypothetical protein
MLWSNDLWKNIQGNAVANQNQEAGQIMSYYIIHFVLHVQFMDTNANHFPLKGPSVTYIWASEAFKGMQ